VKKAKRKAARSKTKTTARAKRTVRKVAKRGARR